MKNRLDRPLASAGRRLVDRSPSALMGLYRLRYRNSSFHRRILGPSTAILIEGFPRSGNSFANRAFQHANPELADRIATHVHLSAHVIEAARLKVPSIVPFRDPSACIPSLYALRRSVDAGAKDPTNLDTWLRDYIAFAERVHDVADDVVLAPFEKLTSDYGEVIDVVNQKYGTGFVRFNHDERSVEDVFASSGSHLSPSKTRQSDKDRGDMLYAASSPQLRGRADRSYRALLRIVPTQLGDTHVTG